MGILVNHELRQFDEFIINKADASFLLHQKYLEKNQQHLQCNFYLLSYESEKCDLQKAINYAYVNKDITSLRQLFDKKDELFQYLTLNKVVFYITLYFPTIASEIKSNRQHWLSPSTLFLELIDVYKTIHMLKKEVEIIELQQSQNVEETDAMGAKLEDLTNKLLDEGMRLAECGYPEPLLDILPTFNDSNKLTFLMLIIDSWENMKIFSKPNIYKPIITTQFIRELSHRVHAKMHIIKGIYNLINNNKIELSPEELKNGVCENTFANYYRNRITFMSPEEKDLLFNTIQSSKDDKFKASYTQACSTYFP
jgi:hypothetical protein